MQTSPEVKKSFFLRFLLWTSLLGNFYVMAQCIFHALNVHQLDLYFRWYPFNVPAWYNIFLLITTMVTLGGVYTIYTKGRSGFQAYLMGKISTALALLVIIQREYAESSLPFPYVLIPIIFFICIIYPFIISISLRRLSKLVKA